MCHFFDIEFQKNPTLISQLFMLSTFDNVLKFSHDPFFLNHAQSVKTIQFIVA